MSNGKDWLLIADAMLGGGRACDDEGAVVKRNRKMRVETSVIYLSRALRNSYAKSVSGGGGSDSDSETLMDEILKTFGRP